MHYTGEYWGVYPYTNVYEAIKIVTIVQADTVYDNPETGEAKIIILNEAILVVYQM